MNPLELQVQELQQKVDTFIAAFHNASQLDPQLVATLTQLISTPSPKSATAENTTINEAGVATKSVLGIPDGFINIGNVNVPYYN